MIESMSISKMVQTSKMKKALQTTVPTATSTLLYLVIFTCVVIEKAILIHNYPENTQIYLESPASICTAYRLYVNRLTWVIFYLFSYVTDMAHDDIVITGIGFFPDNIVYLLFAEYPPRTVG